MAAPTPKVSRFPRIPLVWIVPIVAAILAGWMLYREWRKHGEEITISFTEGAGLEPRQTKLEYKGIAVGEVKEVRLNRNLHRVIVRVQLDKNVSAIAREGAQFWIVQPEIGFGGVSGLETLLTGARLNVRLGEGPPATRFRGLDAPPAPERTEDGRAFLLRADRVGGLQPKAPVFYRDVKVGEVETARLAEDSTGVLIRIRVQFAYVPLIRANTRFWNAGGVPIQFSLFGGANAQKKSLQSFITGAISLATPEAPGEVAPDGTEFPLYKEADDEWLKWRPAIAVKAVDVAPEEPAAQNVMPGLLGGR
ncbi:MAG: Mammalian cell entry related domain protein [Verrucomicrobia bacterium]|nr:Mammalian cell entry related domain protein [Verrucomicrobiota bacterium]